MIANGRWMRYRRYKCYIRYGNVWKKRACSNVTEVAEERSGLESSLRSGVYGGSLRPMSLETEALLDVSSEGTSPESLLD